MPNLRRPERSPAHVRLCLPSGHRERGARLHLRGCPYGPADPRHHGRRRRLRLMCAEDLCDPEAVRRPDHHRIDPRDRFSMQGDREIIALLNEHLTSELTAINQYFLHAKMQENWGFTKLAAH